MGHTTPFLVENRRNLRLPLSECRNSNAVYCFGVRTFENSTKIAQNLKKRLFPSKKKFYEGVELRFQKEKINTLNLPPLSYGQKIFYQI